MVFPSLFYFNPASFLVQSIKRYEFGCFSGNSCCFYLDFLKFLFFELCAVVPYYSKDLIKVVIISREFLSNLNLSFRIILILFYAFLVM